MVNSFVTDKNITESNSISKSKKFPIVEALIVVLILLAFFITCIATNLALQPVWLDEVLVTDPAANLYFGKGFVSTAWQYQTKEEFWASNAPLHQVLLYHWMLVFGFNPVSVRSINFLLMAIAIAIIWFSVYRLKLVTTSQTRLMLVALLIGGGGITLNYIAGRYDCIGIVLFSGALFAYSLTSEWLRYLLLLTIGIFIPIAGIYLLPYAAILSFLVVVYFGRKFIKEVISLALGGGIGLVFLYILYATNGVAKVLLTSAGGHGLSGAIDKLSPNIGQAEFGEKLKFVITHIPQILAIRLMNLPKWFLDDPSFVALLLLLVGLIIYCHHEHKFRLRSVASFGLAIAVIVPLVLGILRDYPFYYSWMAYIPLAICVTSESSRLWSDRHFLPGRLLAIAVVTYACLPGLPMKIISSFHDQSWQRDYSQVEQFVTANISHKDRVYGDFEAYYPGRKTAEYILLPTYKDVISPQEKKEVSALIIRPENYQSVVNLFGGAWQETQSLQLPQPYDLKIYRKS